MLGPGGTAQLPNPAPGRLWREPLEVGFMVEHLQYLNHHPHPALHCKSVHQETPPPRQREIRLETL